MLPDLKIIITSMNLCEDTLLCIQSLLQAGAQPEQVIVVDNGSTDGTVEAIQTRFENRVHLIANPENVGYSLACNQGFQLALEQGAAWGLLLNNDTEVAPDFFAQMAQALARYPQYRVLHPAVLYYSDPDVIWHMGARRIPGTLIYKNLYPNTHYQEDWPEIIPVDAMSSCALLIHRQVYEAIGLFEPRFIIYWDDIDFCWRARTAGFDLGILTKVKMWHKVSKTMGKVKPRARYLNTRNQLYFYRKHTRGLQRPLMLGFALYKSFLTLAKDLYRRQPELVAPTLQGWRDARRGF